MRMRSIAGLVVLVLANVASAACAPLPAPPATVTPTADAAATPPPPASVTPTADAAATAPPALSYSCGSFPFDPAILTSGPGTDELADDAVAGALRAHLAGVGPDFDLLPDSGWHLVGADGKSAEFVATGPTGGAVNVVLTNGPGGWSVSGWGECQPRVVLAAGLGPAEWIFVPNEPRPLPMTQVFDAMVGEISCAGGKTADGRVVGPQLVKSESTILVIFAVRSLAGAQTCQGGAPLTRVTVDLGESLGDRQLLDGGQFPPADPNAIGV
jgi:hypothetical protein